MSQKTASTHRSWIARGSHRFHIAGYSERKALAGVSPGNSSSVWSGHFEAGRRTWALSCRFSKQGLASISLNLVSGPDVAATASLRIEDPRRRWPAAVWRSDGPTIIRAWGWHDNEDWRWELPVPEAFRGHEERYVGDDDALAILCVVDVLRHRSSRSQTMHRFISAVPPTLSRDFLRLLFPPKAKSEIAESLERHMMPDVAFLVEEIEIQAHKLVLAMQSAVFAAEFRWHKDEDSTIIRVSDMSASTFRAMLRFIYTDELPMKLPTKDTTLTGHGGIEKCTLRRCVAKALDLLVAADRYDLERLRMMCGHVLVEHMDAGSVIPTLMTVHGRHGCQQLEDACIEYIASHHDAYTAMKATEEYKELKESCCSFLLDVTDKVAVNMARKLSDPFHRNVLFSERSVPSSNVGTHEFTIPNFRAIQRSLVADKEIGSGTFEIGGYSWKLWAKIPMFSSSGEEDEEEPIIVYLQLSSDPGHAYIRTSVSFKMDYPSATPPMEQVTNTFTKEEERSGTVFTVLKSAKSSQDDSLTIHCQLTVSEKAYTIVGVQDKIIIPPSNIASHLEHLLVSGQGSDVRFLVEGCDFHAHGLVIAARSPVLYHMVTEAANEHNHIVVRIDAMKDAVFRSVLHFIYTDKVPSIDNLVLHAEDMLVAACRFGLEGMKIACENFLTEHISKENALNTLKLAQLYHCLKLQTYCLEFIALPHVTNHVLKTITLD